MLRHNVQVNLLVPLWEFEIFLELGGVIVDEWWCMVISSTIY